MPERFTGGFFQTNAYLAPLPDGSVAMIDAPEGSAAWLAAREIVPSALLLTHQHLDHVHDAAAIAARGVPVYAWSPYLRALTLEDFLASFGFALRIDPYPVDEVLSGRTALSLGGAEILLSHIPGHSPDSVTYHLPALGAVFSGDTLMAGGIGRSDFPDGSEAQLAQGIREKLYTLPEDTVVFPGHGPATTIGAERAGNPYVRP